MLRALTGILAVAVLKFLGLLHPGILVALGAPWLPLYAFARKGVRCRLSALKEHPPLRTPFPLAYYRMRLRLAALSLRHLRGHRREVRIRIEGEEVYEAALSSGKPVALLGWHQGPVELLHHIPAAPSKGRPFFIFTGRGFSPTLTRLLRKGRGQNGKRVVEAKEQPAALRSWVRRKGVLAVMIDQVPGVPRDWLSLWNGAVQLPIPQNLLDWARRRGAVFIAVSVRLESSETILFRYEPLQPDLKDLQTEIERVISENPAQYNWSYPKIRTHL